MRCWTLLLALATTVCTAQRPWSLGLNAHHGFLWPHRPAAWILVGEHAPALELFAERTVRGDRTWHQRFLLPSYGAALLGSGLGDPTRIGPTFRLVPYLYLPFHRWAHSSWGLRTGWGIGYVAYPYDPELNRQQVAIGSHLNTAIQLAAEFRLVRGRWTGLGGVGVDHWSNGSFQLPNLGLNYLSVHVGVSRRFGAVEAPAVPVDTVPMPARRAERMVVLAAGANETLPRTGQRSVFSLVAQWQWRISPRSALSAGADLFNKGTLAVEHPELKARPRTACTQAGVHVGHALLLGRGELFIQMGAYVYTPVPLEKPLFHRLGGRMRFGHHWVGSIALKSHFAVADHWEFGLGYRW